MTLPDGATLWMLVRVDIHGGGAIMREGLAREEAESLAEAYERRGHHQAYLALPYTRATRTEVLVRERVRP